MKSAHRSLIILPAFALTIALFGTACRVGEGDGPSSGSAELSSPADNDAGPLPRRPAGYAAHDGGASSGLEIPNG
jgi:hypothetical protein